MEWMNETPHGVELRVRAVPRASKNEIQGVHDGALKIRLTTPPVDGKANQALIRFLSKTLKLPASQIEFLRGETSRHKTLRISGISTTKLRARLLPNIGKKGF
jgi:uncharacterized protein